MFNICYYVSEKTNSYDYNMFLQICKKAVTKVKLNLMVVSEKEIPYIKDNSLNYIFDDMRFYNKKIKKNDFDVLNVPVIIDNSIVLFNDFISGDYKNSIIELSEENILNILNMDSDGDINKDYTPDTNVDEVVVEKAPVDNFESLDNFLDVQNDEKIDELPIEQKQDDLKTIHPKKVKIKKN